MELLHNDDIVADILGGRQGIFAGWCKITVRALYSTVLYRTHGAVQCPLQCPWGLAALPEAHAKRTRAR